MRRLVTALTLVGLTALVVWAATWGWRSLVGNLPDNPLTGSRPTQSPCQMVHIPAGGKISSDQVQVSVFNSGDRFGLAGQALDALVERGFLGGEVGNAPPRVRVLRVQVWSTRQGLGRARLVARQFGPGVPVLITKRNLGDGVDVVLGDRFQRLSPAPTSIKVNKAQSFCVPVSGGSAAG